MAEEKKIESHMKDGFGEIYLHEWKEFNLVVYQTLDLPDSIFRGQRKQNWDLQPTLSRALSVPPSYDEFVEKHLEDFKYSARGRRGTNPPKLDENDWWALGQHNGLDTPLLDWTESPYVALFFAFAKSAPKEDETDFRAVFALNMRRVEKKCKEISKKIEEEMSQKHAKEPYTQGLAISVNENEEFVRVVRPMSDDNPRLVNQAGLFTKVPEDIIVEDWVQQHFIGIDKAVLVKIYIPNNDRETILKALNRMNINYSSLFPDLQGSALHANMKLEIGNYGLLPPRTISLGDI